MEPGQSRKADRFGTLAISIITVVVSVVLTYFATISIQDRTAAKLEIDTKASQRTEIYRLVNKMGGELNLRDYKNFRADALVFRQAMKDHRYDQALGIDYSFSDLRLLFTNADDDIGWYLSMCPTTDLSETNSLGSCTDGAKPYLSVGLNTLELALQSRVGPSKR